MTDKDNKPQKMKLTSEDIAGRLREQLKALFPAVFCESCNAKGEPVEAIDFEKLKAELGSFSEVFESRREHYGMDWPGKKNCQKVIQQTSAACLKPCRAESVDFDSTENLFIEGDNLEVLKLLQKSYYGKVKMIYIDPPYNTGKEFIYPDNYTESLETYLSYAGLTDDQGRKFNANTAAEGRFHTKWLNMMYPRLFLARNLLREDGVIFISIDDNEVTNLRKICDEVFGEENFISAIAWKNKYGAGAKTKGFIEVHEYVLCYSKSEISDIESILSEEQIKQYDENKDEKYAVRGGYITQPLMTNSLDDRSNLQYKIQYNGDIISPRKQWVWSENRLLEAIGNNEVVFKKKKNGDYSVRAKVYLKDENGTIRKGKPLSLLNGPYNQDGTQEVAESVGDNIFSFPKPATLIKYLLGFTLNGRDEKDGLFLDFFAGSCTTAHAVMQLNAEDGGNRRFICVQLPEPCDESSEAAKAGYKTIADIGKERIRRAGAKIAGELAVKEKENAGSLPGMGEEVVKPDLGFKVLKLSRSNFNIWDGSNRDISEEQLKGQLEMFVEHIDPAATAEDILFELILKAGLLPTAKIEKLTLAGKMVYNVEEGGMYICLEDEITSNLIDAVATAEPIQFICLDRSFKGNDQLKANAVQTFKAYNQGKDKEMQILFRTV